MASKYPTEFDVFTNPSPAQPLNSTTVPHANQHSNANDAIRAIQSTLGIKPQGAAATVEARIAAIEARLSSAGIA